MGTLSNVKVEPMNVTWGEDVAMVQTITCLADTADSLDGKYFFLQNASGTRFHVWFNTSGGAAVDPAPGGSTAAVVALTTGATAAAVATATEAVIEALSGFDSTVVDNVITVTCSSTGYAQPAYDGGAPSGFTFALTTEGDTAADIGLIDGEIEVAMEEDLVEVKAHQYGSNVLSEIRTGKSVEVTLNFQETSIAQLKKLIRQSGGAFTPAGAGGTEVTGWGTYKDFTQTTAQAKKVTMHPQRLAATDKSENVTLPLAYAKLESLTFSGEDKMVVPVTFKCYPKLTNNARAQYIVYGDGTQTLT